MMRHSTVWRVVAAIAVALFALVNIVGGVYAAVLGELPHAGLHAALFLVSGYLLPRLAPRRDADGVWRWGRGAEVAGGGALLTDRLARLEQAVDSVAVEVERIGEGQRFVTRLFAERGAPRAAGESALPTGGGVAQGATPVRR